MIANDSLSVVKICWHLMLATLSPGGIIQHVVSATGAGCDTVFAKRTAHDIPAAIEVFSQFPVSCW